MAPADSPELELLEPESLEPCEPEPPPFEGPEVAWATNRLLTLVLAQEVGVLAVASAVRIAAGAVYAVCSGYIHDQQRLDEAQGRLLMATATYTICLDCLLLV